MSRWFVSATFMIGLCACDFSRREVSVKVSVVEFKLHASTNDQWVDSLCFSFGQFVKKTKPVSVEFR